MQMSGLVVHTAAWMDWDPRPKRWWSVQFASGQRDCCDQGQWKWSCCKLDNYKDVEMSFPPARILRTVASSSSWVSQRMKALLCGASCLITALEWARMWQSSSSINITWQAKRHQFVKCKSPQCSSMSPSLFCQVPCRPKDSKWVPIHILFSSFSHLSCFLTDREWWNTICSICIFPMNVKRCILFLCTWDVCLVT